MILRGADWGEIILSLPVILFALTIHEYGHAWVAWRLGDPTARAEGRVTLNPLRHLDPFGTIALLLFGFGWARPVPINLNFLRHQARDFALTALAGPGMNLAGGLVFGLLFRLFHRLPESPVTRLLLIVCLLGFFFNLMLAAFNLIPIPPLDGSRVVYYLLPRNLSRYYIQIEPFGMYILIALLVLDRQGGIIHSWLDLFVRAFGGLVAGPGFRF